MTRKIFDIYNDVLRELDGTSIPKMTVIKESDYITLSPGTNNNIYQFYVDPAICGNVNVKFQMTNFATVAGEIPSGTGDGVYDPSDYISDTSISFPYKMTTTNFYNSTLEKTIAPSATEDVVSVNIENIPFNYDHADILIQYSVKTDGEFDVTWDGNWTLSQQGSFPENITPSDLIQSDNSDVDLDYIGSNTTLVQRFYIKAIPNMRTGEVLPSSTLTMSVKNNLGTSITLSNIIVKPTFFHYADYPADGTSGSSAFATSNTYPEGDTCYYVKTTGQIIVKLTSELLNVTSPSSMWRNLGTQSYIQGWYYVSSSPEVIDWVMLEQDPNNSLIFTQKSSDDYLTPEQVTIWKSTGGLYYGPINYISLYNALKKMTRFEYGGSHESGSIIEVLAYFVEPSSENWELYPPPYNYQAYDPYWQSVDPTPTSWWEVWKTFVLGETYTGYTSVRFRLGGQYGLIGTFISQDDTDKRRLYYFDMYDLEYAVLRNKFKNATPDVILDNMYFESYPPGFNRYVTKKITSANCGRKDTNETDPDDPNVFPTAPVGPSYMQYMLNSNNDWIQISSGTSLLYIEKTDTGTTPEDYDGTVDQFYIGYKNLNSISYYTPATIAVNCIVSYEQFKDTYVYGDYY